MIASHEVLRQVEQFAYHEAALLDDWKTTEWLGLFTEDCCYEVTPLGEADPANLSPASVYFLIADNRERLSARVTRMDSPAAHVEYPRSRTRHLYTNVRVIEDDGRKLTAWLNFHTFRNRNRMTFSYMGCARYELQRSDANPYGLQIVAKRVMLDMDALIPQGKVSIFL
ncbi:MAG: aromatic-ring-hydroxylating dioxygenase subunit beta [Panacagrimonas sp.]